MPLLSRSDRTATPDGRADISPCRAGAGEGLADPRCPVEVDGVRWPESGGTAAGAADQPGPCATCSYRTRCIRFGWLSPRGHWFESHVVIAPLPGCRGHERSAGDIARRFGRA